MPNNNRDNTSEYGDAEHPVRQSDLESLTYTDSSGTIHKYPIYGQGPHKVVMKADGTIIDPDGYYNDITVGFTNPNLHRRFEQHDPPTPEDPNYNPDDPSSVDHAYLNQELQPRTYELSLQGTNSYRTTTLYVHNEESIDSEIP